MAGEGAEDDRASTPANVGHTTAATHALGPPDARADFEASEAGDSLCYSEDGSFISESEEEDAESTEGEEMDTFQDLANDDDLISYISEPAGALPPRSATSEDAELLEAAALLYSKEDHLGDSSGFYISEEREEDEVAEDNVGNARAGVPQNSQGGRKKWQWPQMFGRSSSKKSGARNALDQEHLTPVVPEAQWAAEAANHRAQRGQDGEHDGQWARPRAAGGTDRGARARPAREVAPNPAAAQGVQRAPNRGTFRVPTFGIRRRRSEPQVVPQADEN